MNECCGNCNHNRYDRDDEMFYCGNRESDHYGTPTFYDDVCDDYEVKWDE